MTAKLANEAKTILHEDGNKRDERTIKVQKYFILNFIKIMNISYTGIIILLLSSSVCLAQKKYGANIPWTTFEAENMNTNGTVMGPCV
ncbi:MAG: hypothetical protein WDM71_07285 [Ferruginibacter sp.]